jgi:arabinose-5-phosphate isomerase
MSQYSDTASRVIRHEAQALNTLADSLGPELDQAIQKITATTGRVIVSGIGKSGHIARKIAATFASTGTPAQFVHPAEASHGDLGMVTQADLVLAISNSGEAPELANLINFTRRFDIPLLALTSKAGSTLAKNSDIVLLMPAHQEACRTGVVPTTSTTLTLAYGDALAVALMEHKSFSAEDFRDFHPGGKLGAQLSRVQDLMHSGTAVPLVPQGTPMSEALLEISQKGFGVVGITGLSGALTGIITDGDLRRHMSGLLDLTAADVMTHTPRTIRPDALAQEAVKFMTDQTPKVTCLFVVEENGTPIGFLHIHDCLRVGLV